MDMFWAEYLLDAERNYKVSLGRGMSIEEAYGKFQEYFNRGGETPVDERHRGGAETLWSALWYKCGLPRVVVGAKLVGSLACTSVPQGAIETARAPWQAFAIDLPDGSFPMACVDIYADKNSPYLIDRQITRIKVLAIDEAVFVIGFSPRMRGGKLHQHNDLWVEGSSLDDFESFDSITSTDIHYDSNERYEREISLGYPHEQTHRYFVEQQRRAKIVLGRIGLGASLELTQHRAALAHAAGTPTIPRGPQGEPRPTVFSVTRDVLLDCRPMMRDYVRGGGTAPSVRSVVRGHWKMQTHGPRGSLRKFIHVEPYWKGDPDAPIAVKAHVLGSDR